jgi:hypothetical protein
MDIAPPPPPASTTVESLPPLPPPATDRLVQEHTSDMLARRLLGNLIDFVVVSVPLGVASFA